MYHDIKLQYHNHLVCWTTWNSPEITDTKSIILDGFN